MKRRLILLLALTWPAFHALQAQSALAAADQENLIFLAEEEKMALDFYQAMENKWEAKVFSNIAEAEQRHLDKLTGLAASQGVNLPKSITAGKAGKFKNKALQQLYDEVIASGSQSLENALRAGARIEETDISDLKKAFEAAANEDLRTTYQYLIDASGNHLRAFNKNLAAQGVAYQPTLLSQADFDAIVGAEGSGQGCQGKKAQAGKGKGCCQGKGKGEKKGQCCGGGGKGKVQQPMN